MMTLLHATRDELLPMVLSAQTDKIKLNIYIEETLDVIVVAGSNLARNTELGFAITHAAIVDGTYRSSVVPSIRRLVHLLEVVDPAYQLPPQPIQDPGTWHTH